MKSKIIKISLLILMIALTIFGIYNLVKNEVEEMTISQTAALKASTSTNIKLANGEINPSTYTYNTQFDNWEYQTYTYKMANGWHVPYKPGYEVYCVEPNAHVRDIWELTYGNLNNIFGTETYKYINKSGNGIKTDIKSAFGITLATHRMECKV